MCYRIIIHFRFEKKFVDLRQPVEKELKEFITLTKWDDSKTSYYRLKENSEKSHRTLVKISKKYEEILDQAASEIFNAPTDDNEKQIEQPEASQTFTTTPKDYLVTLGASASLSDEDSELKNLFSLDDSTAAHNRLDILARVMRKICEKDILKTQSITFLKNGIESLEETSTTIIQRMAHLRDHETEKSVKKFALTELLKGLQELGLSSRQSSSSLEQKESYFLFTSSPLDIVRLIGGSHVLASSHLELWNKVNDYHYKNILRLIRLRQYAKTFSKDVSKREVEKSMGFVENLFFVLSQQRDMMLHLVKENRNLEQYVSLLESISRTQQNSNSTSSILFPPQEISKQFIAEQKAFFDQLCDLLSEYVILHSSLPPVHSKAIIRDLISKSEQVATACKTKINTFIARQPFLTEQFVTYDAIELVKGTISQFSQVRVWLRQLSDNLPGALGEPLKQCISKSNELESRFLKETMGWENKENINSTSDLAKKFVQDINTAIFHIQISIQKLRETHNSKMINEVENEESEMPANYLSELQKHFQTVSKALDIKSLNEVNAYIIRSKLLENRCINSRCNSTRK